MTAIMALQGAFAEHQQMLQHLGEDSVLIRNLNDWNEYLVAMQITGQQGRLILPGGESTAMMRILRDEQLLAPVSEAIKGGMPTFGTCAGMILLDDQHLFCMDVTVRRNAYGRQLGSFRTLGSVKGITEGGAEQFPMVFIRAPFIDRLGEGVEVLSVVDDNIVAVRQGNMLATAYHPELTTDTRLHEMFLKM